MATLVLDVYLFVFHIRVYGFRCHFFFDLYMCEKLILYATRNYHTFLMAVGEGGALVGGGGAVRPQAEMDWGSHVGMVL